MRLYCYICGKTIGLRRFFLMTMKPETDRVFLCCDDDHCRIQVEDGTVVIEVRGSK